MRSAEAEGFYCLEVRSETRFLSREWAILTGILLDRTSSEGENGIFLRQECCCKIVLLYGTSTRTVWPHIMHTCYVTIARDRMDWPMVYKNLLMDRRSLAPDFTWNRYKGWCSVLCLRYTKTRFQMVCLEMPTCRASISKPRPAVRRGWGTQGFKRWWGRLPSSRRGTMTFLVRVGPLHRNKVDPWQI